MFLGLFGGYGKNETVDVHFRRGGKTQVISDAKVAALMRVCLMIEGQESRHLGGLAGAAPRPARRARSTRSSAPTITSR